MTLYSEVLEKWNKGMKAGEEFVFTQINSLPNIISGDMKKSLEHKRTYSGKAIDGFTAGVDGEKLARISPFGFDYSDDFLNGSHHSVDEDTFTEIGLRMGAPLEDAFYVGWKAYSDYYTLYGEPTGARGENISPTFIDQLKEQTIYTIKKKGGF